jgi:nitrogen regulatory protein P-II 1
MNLSAFSAGTPSRSTFSKQQPSQTMKKIEAIIRTSQYEAVKKALHEIDIDFFTWWDVTGQGNDKKHRTEIYRGTVRDTSYISRRYLSIVVRDINLQKTVDCLLKYARTGEVGDGKIFVSDIAQSYRIRTGESGDESLYNKD